MRGHPHPFISGRLAAAVGRSLLFSLFAVAVVFPARAGTARPDSAPSMAIYRAEGVPVVRLTTPPQSRVAGCTVERRGPETPSWTVVGKAFLVWNPYAEEPSVLDVSDSSAPPSGNAVYRCRYLDTSGEWTESVRIEVDLSELKPLPPVPNWRSPAVVRPVPTAGEEGERVKIEIEESGLYRIGAGELASCLAGVSTGEVLSAIGATNLAFSSQGSPVAWRPTPAGDGVLFYGDAIDSIYTGRNVYWTEPGAGTLMSVLTGSGPTPVESLQTFFDTVHFEENVTAPVSIFSDPEGDFWLWTFVHSLVPSLTKTEVFFDLAGVEGSVTGATIRVFLKGASSISYEYPDHHVDVSVNDVPVGELVWGGFEAFDDTFAVTNLLEGTNKLTLEVTDTHLSYIFLDSFDVTYPRRYEAADDRLFLRAESNAVVTVSGFTTNDVRVLDIEDPLSPVLVEAVTIDAATNGDYRVSFVPAAPDTPYLVTAVASTPARVVGRSPRDLHAVTNRADHVAVTIPEFEVAAADLEVYREEQGLEGMVVLLEDVYDEFNHGIASPWAIRSFLQHAVSTWAVPPSYVVLLGNGTYDYRDYKGVGDCLVPSVMFFVDEEFGLRASDNPLGDLDGDGVMDAAIGRFPVVNAPQISGMIAKIRSFEASTDSWKDAVIMLADEPDGAGDFHDSSDQVLAHVPTPPYTIQKLYQYPDLPGQQLHDELIQWMENGCRIVNYVGHGNRLQFGGNATNPSGNPVIYLSTADVPTLTNDDRAPIVCGLTCDSGVFMHPGNDSVGELLANSSNGGAVAVWASVSPAYNGGSTTMDEALFTSMFEHNEVRFGDAIIHALETYAESNGGNPYWPFLLKAYALLGDPATVLAPPGFSYPDWLPLHFTGEQMEDPAVSGENADPDGDGIDNLTEFALNLDPWTADTAPLAAGYAAEDDGQGGTNEYWTVTFQERKWYEGIVYRLEINDDMVSGTWTDGTGLFEEVSRTDADSLMQEVVVRFPASSGRAFFVRLRVDRQ